jgi:glycosyltransferase involved in cell wall biosynthesis
LFLASDIFVMPSVVTPSGNRDGLPTVILEALLHRVPVIATNISGIPEIIEDKVTGRLVPEKDPAAIAQAIRNLIADREDALAMAERGRARVRDQFDADRNHRRLLELYQELPRAQPKAS